MVLTLFSFDGVSLLDESTFCQRRQWDAGFPSGRFSGLSGWARSAPAVRRVFVRSFGLDERLGAVDAQPGERFFFLRRRQWNVMWERHRTCTAA